MNAHSKQLGRDCVKAAKKKLGIGWDFLSVQMQRGVVCQELVHILLSQDNRNPASALEHCQDVCRSALATLDNEHNPENS
jgi:hypothetical protein